MKRFEITYGKDTLHIEKATQNNQPETYLWRKYWIWGGKKTSFKHLGKNVNSFVKGKKCSLSQEFWVIILYSRRKLNNIFMTPQKKKTWAMDIVACKMDFCA